MEETIVPEILSRRALRALSERPVSAETLERILEAATLAPSCMNSQPWRILVMQDEASLARGRAALTPGNYWAKKAPLLVALITSKTDDCVSSEGRDYALFDCGLAAENLMLQATREGLVAHPMAGFDATQLKRDFTVADDSIPIVLIAIGFPGDAAGLSEKHKAAEAAPRLRKSPHEVAFQAGGHRVT